MEVWLFFYVSHFKFLAEIAESAEMAACGLGLLRSWYVSRKSRRGFSASGHQEVSGPFFVG